MAESADRASEGRLAQPSPFGLHPLRARRVFLRLALVGVSATSLLSTGCVVWIAQELYYASKGPEPMAARWVEVEHPDVPVTFELPENYWTKEWGSFGWPVSADGERIETPVYAVHAIRFYHSHKAAALSIRLDCVAPSVLGADRGELAELAASPSDFKTAAWFFRRVFVPRTPNAEFDEFAATSLSGREGSSFRARKKTEWGWFDDSRVVVVPLSREAAIVVQAEFDFGSGPDDREAYARFLASIETAPVASGPALTCG